MIEPEPSPTTVEPATRRRHLNGATRNGMPSKPDMAEISVDTEEYTYVFPYYEPSSYSHVVDLARQYIAPGQIVDLGAGAGAIGEPLQDAGFTYVAIEKHRGALRLLDERNFRNYAADLHDTDALDAILDELPETRAFCLIDVLEHLHEPEPLLRFLSDYARDHHGAQLLISVPNVAHRDVALNLLRGQWNVTEHGLLDKTHVAYYTRQSLLDLFARCGWQLVTRNDFALDESDQYDPTSVLHSDSLIGQALRYTSEIFNPDNAINQFIWLLKPMSEMDGANDAVTVEDADENAAEHPLVSVLVRTQGTRNELLTEALFSVFAQDADDYEIVVCFHNLKDSDGSLLEGVQNVIANVPVALHRTIRLIVCTGTGRSAPLNQLYAEARGDYLTILDDDDLLFPRHISTVKKGIEKHGIGPMFQTYAIQRQLDVRKEKERSPEYGFKRDTVLEPKRATETYPYTVQSIELLWARPFDPLKQQYSNAVHVSNFFVPKRLIEQTSLRFRNDFEYAEDWQFWMEASQILRIVTLPEITGVQNFRTNGTNTVANEELQPEWISTHRKRFTMQERHPLILDGRTARLIYRRHLEERAAMERRLYEMQVEHERIDREYQRVRQAFQEQSDWAHDMETRLQSRQGGLVRRIIRRALRK